MGSNVLDSAQLELIVTDPVTSTSVCDVTIGVINQILNAKELDLTLCPALLTENMYFVKLINPEH